MYLAREIGPVCRKRCDSPKQIHDLVAAIWLEVIDASERFDPSRGSAVPWILGVATSPMSAVAVPANTKRSSADDLSAAVGKLPPC